MNTKLQDRLVFVAEHLGILPYGFCGNAAHFSLGEQDKEELLNVAMSYGYDKAKTFEEMFEELLAPIGYAIGKSCVIYQDAHGCTRFDHVFITVKRGHERLATIKPESQWSYSQRSKNPRCGVCDKREKCEFFKAGLHMPKFLP